jgi:hypothetical protein
MFGFGGSSSNSSSSSAPTAANSRVKRAQQLRQQRLAATNKAKSVTTKATKSATAASGGGGGGGVDDDEVLVVSGACTIFCGLLIVCLGAAMATLFFMIQQPDCMKGVGWGLADASFASPEVQQKAKVPDTSQVTGLRRMKELGSPADEQEGDEVAAPADAVVVQAAAAAVTESGTVRGGGSVIAAKDAADIYMPLQCTASQMSKLAQQLQPGGCVNNKGQPWRRTSCSFSMATSCHDPSWFHQHYAKAELSEGFTSIHVGCNKGYQALDMLAIGNKDPKKYDWLRWRKAFLEDATEKVYDSAHSCPHADVYFNGKTPDIAAQAFCIEPVPKNFQQLQLTKNKLGVSDELYLSQVAMSNMVADEILVSNKEPLGVEGTGFGNWQKACGDENRDCTKVAVDTLDHWITTTPLAPDAPIHYMSLGLEGYDYAALVGGAKTLNRLHYLDVQYHWVGHWGMQSLLDMVTRLKRKHFVCYFAGDQNLWRITDCWQDHYEHRFYANIACVNTQLAEPLAKEMEAIFEKTLEKDLHFGDK